jgi:hypothetical protein
MKKKFELEINTENPHPSPASVVQRCAFSPDRKAMKAPVGLSLTFEPKFSRTEPTYHGTFWQPVKSESDDDTQQYQARLKIISEPRGKNDARTYKHMNSIIDACMKEVEEEGSLSYK